MSSITLTSFENPQNNTDAEITALLNVSFPLTLTSGVRNEYSPNNYSIIYSHINNSISIYTWSGELWLPATITYTFGNSPSPNSYTNTYYVTFDDYSRPSVQATYFKTSSSAPNSGGGGGGQPICFLGNAPVLTSSGYRRIDSLAVGDMVRTADGRDVAIQRVKHQRVVAPSAAVNPYVIPKGQFGATENLAISPRHAVAVPGRGMVEARELGLRQLSMKAAFDYYNLELPAWDNMVVAGVEVESLAPKKRVVMTVAEFRGLLAAQGIGRSAADLAKLSRFVEMLADGRVAVTMSQRTRRM